MISEFLSQAQVENLFAELGQLHAPEFEDLSRSILVKKISPDHYRSIFRVFDALSVAQHVAEERRAKALAGSPALREKNPQRGKG